MALLDEGASIKEAADIILYAVKTTCPEHISALQDFVNRNQGDTYAVA